MRSVVGGILDDGVISDAEFVEKFEEFSDVHVMFHHAVLIVVSALARETFVRLLDVSAEMHARPVPPAEKWFPRLVLSLDEIFGRS